MITVGLILANIRRNKGYQQTVLLSTLKQAASVGQIRDIEAGRTAYIKPPLLLAWMDWLELTELEREFLVQENVRCHYRHELKQVNILKAKPQLLAVFADIATLATKGANIDTTQIVAELVKHTLPHLLKRPPYVDTIMSKMIT